MGTRPFDVADRLPESSVGFDGMDLESRGNERGSVRLITTPRAARWGWRKELLGRLFCRFSRRSDPHQFRIRDPLACWGSLGPTLVRERLLAFLFPVVCCGALGARLELLPHQFRLEDSQRRGGL
jgi:hypothetical protein